MNLNDNDSFIEAVRKDLIEDYLAAARADSGSPSHGESASVSAFPTRQLGLAHGQHMDTVMPGHFSREGRP